MRTTGRGRGSGITRFWESVACAVAMMPLSIATMEEKARNAATNQILSMRSGACFSRTTPRLKNGHSPHHVPSKEAGIGPALDELNQTGQPLKFNHDRNMVTSQEIMDCRYYEGPDTRPGPVRFRLPLPPPLHSI